MARLAAAALALMTMVGLVPAPAHAVGNCRVRVVRASGAIRVSAYYVSGPLTWGEAAGQETHQFANAASCISGSHAYGCELGAPGTPEQITPPMLCRIFVSDGSAESCSAFVRGCTPGLRDASLQGPP